MKILIIGVGGIGSFLSEHLFKQIEKAQLCADITIADEDMVELKQIKWQNFSLEEIGKSKSYAIGMRYDFNVINKRITKEEQLKGFDLIMICVDNEKTRELVVRYCHKNKTEFIDLRATGRRIFAMVKAKTLQSNLKFIDSDDKEEYSCQDKEDLKRDWIQIGNQIIASAGCQMVLNHYRGHSNKTILLTI